MDNKFSSLESAVLTMGDMTAEAVSLAVQALVNNDAAIAAAVREIETQVDSMYYEINEHCLDSLAARQCSRNEVNFVTGSLKIAMELERTCDYANQIAKLVQRKFAVQNMKPLEPLNSSALNMKDQSVEMLQEALSCYKSLDAAHTWQVLDKDTSVDRSNRDLFRDMVCILTVHPWIQETIMDYHVAIRYIERVADRATNVAELVYYIVQGKPMKKNDREGDETLG